jgi:hypothetical protein
MSRWPEAGRRIGWRKERTLASLGERAGVPHARTICVGSTAAGGYTGRTHDGGAHAGVQSKKWGGRGATEGVARGGAAAAVELAALAVGAAALAAARCCPARKSAFGHGPGFGGRGCPGRSCGCSACRFRGSGSGGGGGGGGCPEAAPGSHGASPSSTAATEAGVSVDTLPPAPASA